MLRWFINKASKSNPPPHVPKVMGDIAAMGLEDWWLSTFSESDREWMADTYAPLGGRPRPLVEGGPFSHSPNRFSYLSNAATWFSKPGHEHCAIAFLNKAMEHLGDDMNIIDRHFALYNLSETFYRWRETVSGALDNSVKCAEMAVSFHEETAQAFSKEYNHIPRHPGFTRLRIVAEKKGDFDKALELCLTAQRTGWEDDWPKHIARIEKKLLKATKAAKA
ncbi:hypothetical protein [Pseudogemmobacter faecipullorum]|uniref:Tetratricopeptide repeat protein n=1 Tax=Pseudogemmobacter faecipullorum TaxID=2755041 RepID=A0ABS8CJA1_9RHOB|nr:hypothetical protein [Pseudogemmobacter faecipullorum]MCB5409456.1 hypothetical protein [Pseudogemmobacter faecipullorum]